jgi:IS5 family transposase
LGTRPIPLQGYNAQLAATVDGLIVAARISDDNQDRRELLRTFEQVLHVGTPHTVVADTGYDNHEQITQLEQASAATVYIPPQMPVEVQGRQTHARLKRSAERRQRLARVRSVLGQALLRQRQTIVEPIFGIIKSARRFNHFLLRGLAQVEAEWTLVCTAFNLRRIHRLASMG